jgi:two-component sensor histidine kinase
VSAEATLASPSVGAPPPETVAPVLRKARRRWEAADTVIAISAGLVLIITGIFALLCVQGYSATIEMTKTRGQVAANIVAEETRWVVSSALTLAKGAAGAFNNDPARAGPDTLARFQRVTAMMPTPISLGVYDASGKSNAAASSPGVPTDIADRDYFQTVLQGADWAISAQEKDAATGKATFAVIRRISDAGGTFLGATIVAIDAGVLENFAAPQNLGAGSTISIVRADGWVIARLPSLTQPLNLAGTDAFKNLSSGATGSYLSSVSPVDGMSRMVSYRHVDDLGYIAIASISVNTALAGLWTAIWTVSWLMAPIAIALVIGSVITARLVRRTQATSRSLAAAVEHNEVLFREIHHRVKNNLQSVASLLQMQPIPREIKINMGQRIAAMSAVHEHIYRSNDFATVRVKSYLETLIGTLRSGHDPGVEVIEDIDDVAVDKDAATPLGLIVNEVVSNAFKHAFTDGRKGRVVISLKRQSATAARLAVEDNGPGFDPHAPTKGIGRRLIEALTTQLGGNAGYEPVEGGGSRFTMTFPLASP